MSISIIEAVLKDLMTSKSLGSIQFTRG